MLDAKVGAGVVLFVSAPGLLTHGFGEGNSWPDLAGGHKITPALFLVAVSLSERPSPSQGLSFPIIKGESSC